jgi:hypothetical protein
MTIIRMVCPVVIAAAMAEVGIDISTGTPASSTGTSPRAPT